MDSKTLVELALRKLSCHQKDLAARLKVSPTQISKWKNGDYMSEDMGNKLAELAGIDATRWDFVNTVGSDEDARKWEALIKKLAQEADEAAETGYETTILTEDQRLLCMATFALLKDDLGVAIPRKFPKELEIVISETRADGDEDDEWDSNAEYDAMKHPITSLLRALYGSLASVFGFYVAYIEEITTDDSLDMCEMDTEIYSSLIGVAASKLDPMKWINVAPKLGDFGRQEEEECSKRMREVKTCAIRNGIPLRAELMRLASMSAEDLAHDAEREALGFNDLAVHPDVYMNELLTGIRAIHQVLPAIMKKLGIGDSTLDISDLYVGKPDSARSH